MAGWVSGFRKTGFSAVGGFQIIEKEKDGSCAAFKQPLGSKESEQSCVSTVMSHIPLWPPEILSVVARKRLLLWQCISGWPALLSGAFCIAVLAFLNACWDFLFACPIYSKHQTGRIP